jgi:hypothetical protein
MSNNTARPRRRKPITATTADVTIEDGWSFNFSPDVPRTEGFAIIGVTAESERGESFLTAYFAEAHPDPEADDDAVVAAAHLAPQELDQFKRMAAAAGVSVDDQTRTAR